MRQARLLLMAAVSVAGCDRLLAFGLGGGDGRAVVDGIGDGRRGEGGSTDGRRDAPGLELRAGDTRGPELRLRDNGAPEKGPGGPPDNGPWSDASRSDGPRGERPPDTRPADGQTPLVPKVQWMTPLLGSDTVAPTAVAADPSSGRIFVTGGFTKDLSFKGTKYTAPAATADGFLASFLAIGTPDWFQQVFSSSSEDRATDVLFSGGRAWAAGYHLVASYEARLVGFPPSGVGPIGEQSSGSGSERALAAAVDPASGDLFLGGSFQGQASFGGKVLAAGVGAGDGFVARYAPDLSTVRWVQRVGISSASVTASVEVRALTVETSGVINAFGVYSGTLLGCGASANRDLFAVRLDSTGTQLGCVRFGSAGNDDLIGAAGRGNAACFAGTLAGPASIGGISSGSIGSGFVACFSGGFYHWWRPFGGGGSNAAGRGVALDGSGNVYLGGSYSSVINLGGAPLPAPAGAMDGFVASFSPVGQHRWSVPVSATGVDLVEAVTVLATDNVVAAGQFNGTLSGVTCTGMCGYVVQLK